MSLTFGVASVQKPRRPVSKQNRKVAIFGSHQASLEDAPWDDPSWELHGHASSRAWYKYDMDVYYDLHPPSVWTRGGKKTAHYPKWLAKNTVPIYMQERFPQVPASRKYPKARILSEFSFIPRPYFTNHVAWIIALALTEGVDSIGLWGIEYGIQSEYQIQRACCEAWLFLAAARGVKIVLPDQCSLLRQPAGLYGYESHDLETGQRVPEYTEKKWKVQEDIKPVIPGQPLPKRAEPPKAIAEEIRLEEEENIRPDWALGPLGGNGGVHKEA